MVAYQLLCLTIIHVAKFSSTDSPCLHSSKRTLWLQPIWKIVLHTGRCSSGRADIRDGCPNTQVTQVAKRPKSNAIFARLLWTYMESLQPWSACQNRLPSLSLLPILAYFQRKDWTLICIGEAMHLKPLYLHRLVFTWTGFISTKLLLTIALADSKWDISCSAERPEASISSIPFGTCCGCGEVGRGHYQFLWTI